MWQHVLAQTSSTCKLCGECVVDEMRLEHCFVLCPAISDLQGHQLTLEEIQYPEPSEFRRVLAFVASVLERHRWQAADFETLDQGEKIKGPKERTVGSEEHSAHSSEKLLKLGVAKSNQEKSKAEKAEIQEINETEQMQMPFPRVETTPGKPEDQSQEHQNSEPKVLHLVLQPQRSHDASPLGQWRERILKQVAENRVTIIVAPTGCGKSTRSLA